MGSSHIFTHLQKPGSGTLFTTALLLSLVACFAPEILAPRSGSVPLGIDFSGNWLILGEESDGQRRVREAIRNTDGVRDSDFRRQQSPAGAPQKVRGGLVHVFLETGRSLKITQTAHGLFISFDRSVVEEFRFGESRMINVGAVEAQRVAGWESNELVVETLDRNGMKLTERFSLADNGRILERNIVLRSRSGDEEMLTQRFERQDN